MKTAENIHKISFIFFLIFGFIHITSALMAVNNYIMPISGIIQRSLDIPFAMTGVIYGLSGIYTSLDEKKHDFIRTVFIIITLLILGILLYINILVPDKIQA